MAPRKEPEPALAAPGLIGPNTIEKPPMGGPRSLRRTRNRPFAHVRLEVEIDPRTKDGDGAPAKSRRTGAASATRAEDPDTFVVLAAGTLHAMAARQFRQVDAWNLRPGGPLPTPEAKVDANGRVPIGDVIAALERAAQDGRSSGRSFRAVVSGADGNRVELALRRETLSRASRLTLDLFGEWTKLSVHALEGAVGDRLPVTHSEMVKYRFA